MNENCFRYWEVGSFGVRENIVEFSVLQHSKTPSSESKSLVDKEHVKK